MASACSASTLAAVPACRRERSSGERADRAVMARSRQRLRWERADSNIRVLLQASSQARSRPATAMPAAGHTTPARPAPDCRRATPSASSAAWGIQSSGLSAWIRQAASSRMPGMEREDAGCCRTGADSVCPAGASPSRFPRSGELGVIITRSYMIATGVVHHENFFIVSTTTPPSKRRRLPPRPCPVLSCPVPGRAGPGCPGLPGCPGTASVT